MATTTADVSMTTGKRAAAALGGKRRMSRDSALPDVTNFPEVQLDHRAANRRQSLANRTASLTSASGQENGDGAFDVTAGGHGDPVQPHVQPERAAKIAARAKMKAVFTPQEKLDMDRPTNENCCYTETRLTRANRNGCEMSRVSEEWMDMDRPGLVLEGLQLQVSAAIIDIDHHDDYFLAPAYAQDIIAYLRKLESQMVLPPDYLSVNPDITSQMRGILVDWLIQVHAHEQLEEESLQLCVRLTDLYLSRALVPMHALQLLGVTCLLLAAKFIERFPPLVLTLCSLTAGTYQESEVLEMEKCVLCVLQFSLSQPLPLSFLKRMLMVHHHDVQFSLSQPLPLSLLKRMLMVHHPDVQVERLANYLVDLSLPSVHFVSVAPSVLACSALYVARRLWLLEEPEPWSQALVYYSGYELSHLAPAVTMLAKILLRAPLSKYQGARQKHSAEDPHGAISIDPVLDSHPLLLTMAKGSL
ncbi:hypothetical protein ACOMHN_043156 [Nucella lapillus]